jgi:hypothetical protein
MKFAAAGISAVVMLTTAAAQTVVTRGAASPPSVSIVSGTILGRLDLGQGAWVGTAYLRFGQDAPRTATFIDRNNSMIPKSNGGISGTETITFTFPDGSFDLVARFDSNPMAAPNLYTFAEFGTITNGKGKYASLSGYLTVTGSAVPPTDTSPDSVWLCEIHGITNM